MFHFHRGRTLQRKAWWQLIGLLCNNYWFLFQAKDFATSLYSSELLQPLNKKSLIKIRELNPVSGTKHESEINGVIFTWVAIYLYFAHQRTFFRFWFFFCVSPEANCWGLNLKMKAEKIVGAAGAEPTWSIWMQKRKTLPHVPLSRRTSEG